MQRLLVERPDPNLRAYFVWEPVLNTDGEATARQSSQRFGAPNSVHFWTPTQKLAKDMAGVLKLAADRIAWDVYLLYRKGILWQREPPSPTYWQHQLGVIQGDSLDIEILEARLTEALRLPN